MARFVQIEETKRLFYWDGMLNRNIIFLNEGVNKQLTGSLFPPFHLIFKIYG